ncbi:type ISP restriction/modification enzyme [Janibacter indicus]
MRLSLAEEFSDIHVYNLRGNQRTAGEQSRKEGGKVFGGGSRATVAITLLVKDPAHPGPAAVHYTDIGDYLTREEKLAKVTATQHVSRLEPVDITPNAHGDWLNQRRDDFSTFMPLGARSNFAVFGNFGAGMQTNRDAWVYGFNSTQVIENVARHIAAYEAVRTGLVAEHEADDPRRLSWTRSLRSRLARNHALHLDEGMLGTALYRPFMKQHLYSEPGMTTVPGMTARAFPVPELPNFGLYTPNPGASAPPFMVLATDRAIDLGAAGVSAANLFARWRYERRESDTDTLPISSHVAAVNGFHKIDNITDDALRRFQAAFGTAFTKDDIFFYVYGLLHSPDYRETYAADLKKSLPRIPLVADAAPFVEAGRRLSELHLGYETVAPFALDGLATNLDPGTPYEYFRVEKMKFAKVRDPETHKLVPDRSTIVYNDRITLSGIPEEAYRYMLGSRSAIEWIMDRYQVKTDKASGIVNDPNDWSREVEDPRYIIDLLARIVNVSLETMKIVDALPPLEIREDQTP